MICKNGRAVGCNGKCTGDNTVALRIEGEADCTAKRIRYDWPIYVVSQLAIHERNLHIDPACLERGANYVELTVDLVEANQPIVDAFEALGKELGLKVTRNPDPDFTVAVKSCN